MLWTGQSVRLHLKTNAHTYHGEEHNHTERNEQAFVEGRLFLPFPASA